MIRFHRNIKVHQARYLMRLMALIWVFFRLVELWYFSSVQRLTGNSCSKSQLSSIHTGFRMCQALYGKVWKSMRMAHRFKWTGGKIVLQKWIYLLCYDILPVGRRRMIIMIFHRNRHNDTRFIWVLLWWRLVLNIYIKQEHLLNWLV